MSTALATWINGPVLRARPDGAFRLREAVTVGEQRLLGEVIRVARDEITVQVYEDTSGLRPGMTVDGSGRLLSVRLGPGILGRIFDGLLRPIGVEAGEAGRDPWVLPGMRGDAPGQFAFSPRLQVGDQIGPGQILGDVSNGDGAGVGMPQCCLVPPDLPPSTVVEVADRYFDDFVAFVSEQLTDLPVALCCLWVAVQMAAHSVQVKANAFLPPVRNFEENIRVGLGVWTTEINLPVHHRRDKTCP